MTPKRTVLSNGMKDGGGTYKVSSAAVKMNADGSIVLLTGTVEVGQGARTALSQVVAEELDVSFGRITVAQLDTDVTPYDVNTNASSSTVVMGLSVQRATQDLKRQLLRHVGSDADWCVRADHPVEFSNGNPDLENVSRTTLR